VSFRFICGSASALDPSPRGRNANDDTRSTGTAFSLLPAENATGNYVKIVQRVPVKIVTDNPPTDVALGPGMSVVPTVHVNPAPSLLERLRAFL
jgi:multidrug resistance efflux pump